MPAAAATKPSARSVRAHPQSRRRRRIAVWLPTAGTWVNGLTAALRAGEAEAALQRVAVAATRGGLAVFLRGEAGESQRGVLCDGAGGASEQHESRREERACHGLQTDGCTLLTSYSGSTTVVARS